MNSVVVNRHENGLPLGRFVSGGGGCPERSD
jgi:hypothetical protein